MASYYNDLIRTTINDYCKGKEVDSKTFTRDVVEYMMLNVLKEAECRWNDNKRREDKDFCNRTRCEWDDVRRKVKLILLDALTEADNEMQHWDILPF